MVQEDPSAARELAQLVGNLPLALVLIEGDLSARAGNPRWFEAAIRRLRSAERRLALASYDVRHISDAAPLTLQAVVELSLDALPAEAIAAFESLAVFAAKPADFSRDAALSVWDVDDDLGDSLLELLHARALVEHIGNDRYTLHQVLATVARARLGDDDDVAAHHFDYYCGLVETRQAAWREIAAELSQIRQAWLWAKLAPDQDARLLDLVVVMRSFLDRRGLWDEELDWYARALGAARKLGRREQEGSLLRTLGRARYRRGELWEAIGPLNDALQIGRETGDPGLEGAAQTYLGSIHLDLGNLPASKQAQEAALAIARQFRNTSGIARALTCLGEIHRRVGDLDAAQRLCRQALDAASRDSHVRREAEALKQLGTVLREQGDMAAAVRCHRDALDIAEDMGDLLLEAPLRLDLAETLLGTDNAAAGRLLDQAVQSAHILPAHEVERARRLLRAASQAPAPAGSG